VLFCTIITFCLYCFKRGRKLAVEPSNEKLVNDKIIEIKKTNPPLSSFELHMLAQNLISFHRALPALDDEQSVTVSAFELHVRAKYALHEINVGDKVTHSNWILELDTIQKQQVLAYLAKELRYIGRSTIKSWRTFFRRHEWASVCWNEDQQCFYIVEAS
jgi:hypothetical protein